MRKPKGVGSGVKSSRADINVEHGKEVDFGGACLARAFMEACPKCEVLTIGLYVIMNAKGEGVWVCLHCAKASPVALETDMEARG